MTAQWIKRVAAGVPPYNELLLAIRPALRPVWSKVPVDGEWHLVAADRRRFRRTRYYLDGKRWRP